MSGSAAWPVPIAPHIAQTLLDHGNGRQLVEHRVVKHADRYIGRGDAEIPYSQDGDIVRLWRVAGEGLHRLHDLTDAIDHRDSPGLIQTPLSIGPCRTIRAAYCRLR